MRLHFVNMMLITMLIERCSATIRYFLYVGGTKTYSELPQDAIITNPAWVKNSNAKILIHGFVSNTSAKGTFDVLNSHMQTILAKEYKKYNQALNIIAVDWKTLAQFPTHQYFSAVKNVLPAGEMIATYISKLIKSGAIQSLNNVHILGLSMGAHVAGAAGFLIQKIMNHLKIGRITGLDPAGPGFSTWDDSWPGDPSTVLDYFDAEFVDIIHTNMGHAILEPILSGALGTKLQAGHVDFYPNGGEIQQKQCSHWEDRFDTCSHNMCLLYYAQALRQPYRYTGCPCDSYVEFQGKHCPCTYNGTGVLLGDLAKHAPHGKYYMTITDILSKETFEKW